MKKTEREENQFPCFGVFTFEAFDRFEELWTSQNKSLIRYVETPIVMKLKSIQIKSTPERNDSQPPQTKRPKNNEKFMLKQRTNLISYNANWFSRCFFLKNCHLGNHLKKLFLLAVFFRDWIFAFPKKYIFKCEII